MNKKTAVIIASILAVVVVVVASISMIRASTTTKPAENLLVTYFNDFVNGDKIGNGPGDGDRDNDYHFGPAVVTSTASAFVDSVIERITPKFAPDTSTTSTTEADVTEATTAHEEEIGGDPALAAAHITHTYQEFKWAYPIPDQVKDLLPGQMPDALHLVFLKDPALWAQCVTLYKGYLLSDGVSLEIVPLESYTSMMYMTPNGLEGDKPSVILRETNSTGGQALKVTDQKLNKTSYCRANCGGQWVDPSYWTPPADTPVDKPPTTVPYSPWKPKPPKEETTTAPAEESTTAPAKETTTTPTTTTTKAAIKDPSKDPVQQSNAPIGGGLNEDPGPGTFQPTEPPKPSTIAYSHYSGVTSAITVGYGTSVGKVGLPTTATYHAKSGETGKGSVNWSTASYDGGTAGTYILSGVILNTNGVAWAPPSIKVSISVTVKAKPATQTAPPTEAPPPPTNPIPVVTDSHDTPSQNAGNENGSFTPPD